MTNFQARVKDGAIKFELVREREEFANHLLANEGDFIEITCYKKGDRPRTSSQNRALHRYYGNLSQELNNNGLSVMKFLKYDFEMDWTPTLVKELIWKPIQKAMFKKESSAKLTRNEVVEVWETLNRHLSSKPPHIHIPFPSKELEQKELDEAIEYEENTLEENNWK